MNQRPDMGLVQTKAWQIVDLGHGMQKNEFFGTLATAAGQALKYQCADTLQEAIE